MVAERTREFGIRMALGANRSSVRTMVMRNSAARIGVVVGLLGAFGLGRLLASALPESHVLSSLVRQEFADTLEFGALARGSRFQ